MPKTSSFKSNLRDQSLKKKKTTAMQRLVKIKCEVCRRKRQPRLHCLSFPSVLKPVLRKPNKASSFWNGPRLIICLLFFCVFFFFLNATQVKNETWPRNVVWALTGLSSPWWKQLGTIFITFGEKKTTTTRKKNADERKDKEKIRNLSLIFYLGAKCYVRRQNGINWKRSKCVLWVTCNVWKLEEKNKAER